MLTQPISTQNYIMNHSIAYNFCQNPNLKRGLKLYDKYIVLQVSMSQKELEKVFIRTEICHFVHLAIITSVKKK